MYELVFWLLLTAVATGFRKERR